MLKEKVEVFVTIIVNYEQDDTSNDLTEFEDLKLCNDQFKFDAFKSSNDQTEYEALKPSNDQTKFDTLKTSNELTWWQKKSGVMRFEELTRYQQCVVRIIDYLNELLDSWSDICEQMAAWANEKLEQQRRKNGY